MKVSIGETAGKCAASARSAQEFAWEAGLNHHGIRVATTDLTK